MQTTCQSLANYHRPSQPVKEAAVEVLRPKFRKDEETAWTIVNSKLTPGSRTQRQESTVATSTRSGIGSMVSIISQRCGIGGSFSGDFEEQLFSGPVYRRLLITKLCEQPVSLQAARHDLRISTQHGDARIEMVQDPATHDDNTLALELRQQGIFSRSYHEDYLEFMARHRPRKMERRHMPLAAILCQETRDHNEQTHIDKEFYKAVEEGDLSRVADALDQGADINCRPIVITALQHCIYEWLADKGGTPDLPSPHTTIAEFLMLYKETQIPYYFHSGVSILHICMHVGATAKFMRPFFEVEGTTNALKQHDKYGRSVLHSAVLSSTAGLYCLQQLRQLFGDGTLQTNDIRDKAGRNVHQFAILEKAVDHIAILDKLGNNQGPQFLDAGSGKATFRETSYEDYNVSRLSMRTGRDRKIEESFSVKVANFSEQECSDTSVPLSDDQLARLMNRRTL